MGSILGARVRLIVILALLLGFVGLSTARLTQAGCFANHCLQAVSNSTGGRTLCLIPDQAPQGGLEDALEDTHYSEPMLDRLVSIHAQGVQRGEVPSIAYWNVLDKGMLGGADWSVNEWLSGLKAGVIAVCLTGPRGDGSSTTICYQATGDDDFAVEDEECNERPASGVIHRTTKPMLRNGCQVTNEASSTFDIFGQPVIPQWHNLPASPRKSLGAHEEVAVRGANPLKAYRLDRTGCATGIPGAVRDVCGLVKSPRVPR